ncbi:MAG: folate family ECF transporter S component [Bacilli bacterium]|nr:folate family ECF transporter S component [Bacilli bacterium]MDD3422853.1 folate family ECF transporter S component [Bacilli bacterium]MDD4065676.1 folate family ECF transporter S component [Bacilli bacterium]
MLNKMNKTQIITISAFLSALSVVLTRFCSILVPVGGVPSLSLELGGVPIVMGGIILGPIWGGIIGFVADVVGFLINPRGGAYFFGFTLNSILTGVIPGLIFILFKKQIIKDNWFPKLTYISLAFITIASALITLLVLNSETYNNIIATIIVIGVNIVIFIVLLVLWKKQKERGVLYQQILISVAAVELLVYVLLSPLWLAMLYGLPYALSMATRVFRMAISIPVKTLIISVLLQALRYGINKKKEGENHG